MISTNEHICMDCKCLIKKAKSGVSVSAESMSGHQMADLWECPKCGYTFLTGFGGERGPFDSEHENLDYYYERLR